MPSGWREGGHSMTDATIFINTNLAPGVPAFNIVVNGSDRIAELKQAISDKTGILPGLQRIVKGAGQHPRDYDLPDELTLAECGLVWAGGNWDGIFLMLRAPDGTDHSLPPRQELQDPAAKLPEGRAARLLQRPKPVTSELSAEVIAACRADLAGKKLSDFSDIERFHPGWVEDTTAQQVGAALGGYQPHGVNSNDFTFKLAGGGCNGSKMFLRVCVNFNADVPPEIQFFESSGYKLLLDDERLPPHRNIMAVFSHFIDESSADTLPNWELDSWVVKRTSFFVMPLFPCNLGDALQSEKTAGNRIPLFRARRIICDILSAVEHLQNHCMAASWTSNAMKAIWRCHTLNAVRKAGQSWR